jgi:hypothetical protein
MGMEKRGILTTIIVTMQHEMRGDLFRLMYDSFYVISFVQS